eukprot:scaffold1146_cov399-Prasinococcus_capsulatus_cf.AAC.82
MTRHAVAVAAAAAALQSCSSRAQPPPPPETLRVLRRAPGVVAHAAVASPGDSGERSPASRRGRARPRTKRNSRIHISPAPAGPLGAKSARPVFRLSEDGAQGAPFEKVGRPGRDGRAWVFAYTCRSTHSHSTRAPMRRHGSTSSARDGVQVFARTPRREDRAFDPRRACGSGTGPDRPQNGPRGAPSEGPWARKRAPSPPPAPGPRLAVATQRRRGGGGCSNLRMPGRAAAGPACAAASRRSPRGAA